MRYHSGGRNDAVGDLPCKKCGEIVLWDKPDPCIGKYLPGIAHACCGHDNIRFAYCCGWDGCKPGEVIGDESKRPGFFLIRREEAVKYLNLLGAGI